MAEDRRQMAEGGRQMAEGFRFGDCYTKLRSIIVIGQSFRKLGE